MKNIGIGLALAAWAMDAKGGDRRWLPRAESDSFPGFDGPGSWTAGRADCMAYAKAAMAEVFPKPMTVGEWRSVVFPDDGIDYGLLPACEAVGIFVNFTTGNKQSFHVDDIPGLRDRNLADYLWWGVNKEQDYPPAVLRALAEEVVRRPYFASGEGIQPWAIGVHDAAKAYLSTT